MVIQLQAAIEKAFVEIDTRICNRQETYAQLGATRKAAVGSCALLVVIDKRNKLSIQQTQVIHELYSYKIVQNYLYHATINLKIRKKPLA
jgi:hypothetical protein